MLRPRTPFLLSALAGLLSVSIALPASATDAPTATDGSEQPPSAPIESDVVQHSSDVTEPVLTARATNGSTAYFRLGEKTTPVAPGLDHTVYDRYDVRGWIRVNALTADLSTPGLKLDYTAPGKVSSPGPLSTAIRRDRAIAGVNGDFFDIGDTGAPLGVGVDRQRGLLHGTKSGWNNAFTLGRGNVAAVARTYLKASISRKGKPSIEVTDLNAPTVHPNGIGIYTSAWGAVARSRVLPNSGPRREVVVRRGKVRANRKGLSAGPIADNVLQLVGTGEGAKKLRRLKVGSRVAVEYGLNKAATRVAVGGNVVLLHDGKVLAPGDLEMHPRTAIGIDTDLNRVIIVAVDGRQEHSRGLTMKETGILLKQMGAEEGLNLDGGGSSTMMSRESGEAVGVVNAPSDGHLRSVPNGLGFAFAKGSGELRGIRIEPAADTNDSHRVLRGLSRVLVARGHDETDDPVAARPRWQGSPEVSARPGPSPRTVVVGRRTGTGTVTATSGAATGRFNVRVLGDVHRLEASVPSIALPGTGRSDTFDVRGYDAQGFDTWVEPRDVRLSYNHDKLRVRRTGRGFTVTARVPSASDVVKVSAGGRETYVGVTIGLDRRLADRMNTLTGWKATVYPAKADATLSLTKNRHGRPGKAIAMSYSLYGKAASRAAYLTAVPSKDLAGRSRRIGVWVRGDGKGAWLRAVVKDASGTRSTLNLSQGVTWKGWRFLTAELPSNLTQPLDFVRLHAVETRKRRYAGTLAFDDLTVFTERKATVPATAPLRDPMVSDLAPLAPRGLRVAVMSNASISATAPDSRAVARTRRTMREIVAAKPNLVLLNGDLVAHGTSADLDLARRVIREELGGKVDWRYVPGEGELGGDGDLAGFRAEFGNPVRVFDDNGTRFVLLNSAEGAFRLGGFTQLLRLRSELTRAATDPVVRSVVVVAHHPTSDPVAGGTAELTDAREAELVEDLLSDFRESSTKSAAYVGSHARRFGVVRRDGVPHVLAGPVSDPARSSTGSFTGWSMLRVDPTASQWLGAEFRPHVDALRVKAPDQLAVGAVAEASASLTQNGRRLRVAYPMNAEWLRSPTVHIGAPGGALPTAVVAYEPETGRLTALRAGKAELTLRVNGVTATHTVTVR
jgi:hypothetical protein